MKATTLRWLRPALLSLVAAAALSPSLASADPRPQIASFQTGDLSQFDQINESVGSISMVDNGYDSTPAARATYFGGGENGYARGLQEVHWGAGDNVWYGAAYYLPRGFTKRMQGAVALLRWDDWESHPNNSIHGGVAIWGHDNRARIVRERLGSNSRTDELSKSFKLPEGRWFWLEVHQRLSAGGNALNAVYLNGRLIDRSHQANLFPGRGVERIRYGIVAIADGAQTRSLTLRFDRASVQTHQLGPLGGPRPDDSGDDAGDDATVTTSRFTPAVRRCVRRALTRAARRGDATGLPRATKRCVKRYAIHRKIRRKRHHR
jgi:hypothetical protein